MIKTSLINTDILSALAKCGHGDQILIASANFPMDSQCCADAKRVYLGVSANVPSATQVLEAIADTINIESAKVIGPAKVPGEPEKYEFFRDCARIMPDIEPERCERYPFYDACSKPSVRLVIQTGDTREFANVLLTMFVVRT